MKKLVLTVCTVFLMVACENKNYDRNVVSVEEINSEVEVSNAASPKVKEKIFKSNAMIEMKVKNVLKDGQEIEQNAVDLNGFVLNNELTNRVIDSKEIDLSNEETKKMEKIQQTNIIELKVPFNQLREHLKFALQKGVIVDHILINNEEMTFEKYKTDLKIEANQTMKLSKQIENKVNKILLNDAVNYATVAYQLNEEPHLITSILPQSNIKLYTELNFSHELKQSWQDGVYFFKKVMIFIFQLLPTIFSLLFLYFAVKYVVRYWRNRESKSNV